MNFKSYYVESTTQEDFLKKALSPELRSQIYRSGGKIYQIGGAVRDELIGKISKDLDIIVVGLEMDELENILRRFGRTDAVGKSFGILKFKPHGFDKDDEPVDVSVPRVDSKSTGSGHKDFEVQLGKGITLSQDQLRRDFFMNALAKDIETGQIHDVEEQGMDDIKKKQVRMISPRSFQEDPLRMIRAIQQASRFEFTIEPKTMEEIQKNAHLIKTVSPDRFMEEFKKLFVKSRRPSIGVRLLNETGIMKEMFPTLKHSKEDYEAMDRLNKEEFPAFMTMFLHPIGTPSEVLDAVQQLRSSNELGHIIGHATAFLGQHGASPSDLDLVKFNMTVKPEVLHTIDVINKSYGKRANLVDRLDKMRRDKIPTNLKELSVRGDTLLSLGLKGQQIGKALDMMLTYAVIHKTNDPEKLTGLLNLR